jgi:hypothetical protein
MMNLAEFGALSNRPTEGTVPPAKHWNITILNQRTFYGNVQSLFVNVYQRVFST